MKNKLPVYISSLALLIASGSLVINILYIYNGKAPALSKSVHNYGSKLHREMVKQSKAIKVLSDRIKSYDIQIGSVIEAFIGVQTRIANMYGHLDNDVRLAVKLIEQESLKYKSS